MNAAERVAKWILEFRLPEGWSKIRNWGDGVACQRGGLGLIIDAAIKDDGAAWLHVSVSRKHGIPSHEELVAIKDQFIGADRYAYFVFPPRECYVNIHRYCLHLWARLDDGDGRALPEFSSQLEGIGRSI